MKAGSRVELGKYSIHHDWNSDFTMLVEGMDNGDRDGPHWGEMTIKLSNPAGVSTLSLIINDLGEIKKIADAFNKMAYKIDELKNES